MGTQRWVMIMLLATGLRLAAWPTEAWAYDILSDQPTTVREGNVANAGIGYATSTAGDVNGDGFSDVLVTGPENHGTVYCYYGGASRLFLSPSWSVSGTSGNSSFGNELAAAGDVNGDGYDDILISDPTFSNGTGIVYVYLGGPSGLASSPQQTLTGPTHPANFGNAIATAGDVNGDGYEDILIGAPQISNGQAEEGRVYLYLGSPSGIGTTPAWTFESNSVNAFLGTRVSTAGDVNGDGYDDVLVSAPDLTDGQNDEGKVYLFLGSPSGLSTSPSWTYEGNAVSAQAGKGLCCAGDLDGDGYGDIILNVFYNTSSCDVLVFYGGPSGLANAPDRVWPVHNGSQLFTAGDLNGDGCADVIAGDFVDNNFTGQINVILGATDRNLWTGPRRTGTNANDEFGLSACAAGDVNGDGFADLIVGEPGYDNGQTDEGRVAIFWGESSPPGIGAFYQKSGQAGSDYGFSLAHGDFNGDGFSDLAVGNPTYSGSGTSQGQVEVFYGNGTGYHSSPDATITGTHTLGQLGYSVANAGDVDNDGCDDLIIGEPTVGDANDPLEGAAYLYRGGRSGLAASPSWTVAFTIANSFYGGAVAGVGDVNGDGYADVLVGAPEYSSGSNIGGAAFLYYGSSNGLNAAPAWTGFGGSVNAEFGISLAGADFNGDGFSDVAIGASNFSGAHANEGKVFVYNGSANGPVGPAGWTAVGGQNGAAFGAAIAAGDIVADGFSDLVIGAPNYDDVVQGHVNAGAVSLYLGQPSGLISSPTSFWFGERTGDFLGYSLAVGDATNDGCCDLLVGAPGSDGQVNNGGNATLYLGEPNSFIGPVWSIYGTVAGAEFGSAVALSDFDADGFGDLFVGSPLANGGLVQGFFSGRSNTVSSDRCVLRRPRQFRADGTTSVALMGATDQQTSLILGGNARSAMGRDRVQLQYQIAPVGTTFSGNALTGGTVDTGSPVSGQGSTVYQTAAASGLAAQSPYHWRLRFKSRSPYFPHTPWISPWGNGCQETDARTGAAQSGVAEGQPSGSALRFARVGPNPCLDGATLSFILPAPGRVRLAIYDIAGRRIQTLADGIEGAGLQSEHWDTRDARGARVPAGVYLARLEQGAGTAEVKMVVRR